MKEPPQYSSFPTNPNKPTRYQTAEPSVLIKTSRDAAAFTTFKKTTIPTRAIKYCSKLCVPMKGFYDKECMQTCVGNYKEVLDLYTENYEWYHKKVEDQKLRGEVPAILQDQMFDDKTF